MTNSFIKDRPHTKGHVLGCYDGQPVEPTVVTPSLHLLWADISLSPVVERDFAVIFRLKEGIEHLRKSSPYDYVLIDCLPSFGHLQLAALQASDYVLIPVRPSPYALAGMKELFKTIEKVRKYFNPDLKVLGIVVNQVDGRGIIIEREMETALRKTYGPLVLKNRIHKRVGLEESPSFHKGIVQYEPKSAAAKDFLSVAWEIKKRINQNETK